MEHQTEAESLLQNLQECVSRLIHGWSGPHCDNSGGDFWFDKDDSGWDYEAHPGYKLTFDECIIALRTWYKKQEPLENYTLEEFILSRIEDGSDK